MAHNVPRVADVARKGYKINCDKKVSPCAPCGNGVNVLLFENLFIIFNQFAPILKNSKRHDRTATRLLGEGMQILTLFSV